MTTAAEAVEESGLLESLIDTPLAEQIKADVESGDATWGWDPNVDGVVGLSVQTALGREVVLILWLEQQDFDVNALYAGNDKRLGMVRS